MITELFYLHILNMTRSSLHTETGISPGLMRPLARMQTSSTVYLKRPEVIQPHLWYASFSRVTTKQVMHFMDVIINQLVSKPGTRLHILHLSPVLLTNVLILVYTRPEKAARSQKQ